MSAASIIRALESLSFDNTFNPYFDRCAIYDTAEAPDLRRHYLLQMLDQASRIELGAIWVGRDLGYRGGRRTGLAFTDDIHFADHLARWNLVPENLNQGALISERTAAVVWDVLNRVVSPVFLWNVFPLHPFNTDDEFSNRAHNASERKAGIDILKSIVEYLAPRSLVAIGNDAFNVLSAAFPSQRIYKVRHPSYGGQKEFLANMKLMYPEALSSTQNDLN
ncbi:MAG: uracil-DNA glycosylase [Rhodobacteraceae bacterium]|nr:uracil-DNA glycosylase [Paracoccaceae bacterium]